MKFLCVKCDVSMRLVATAPPERGSISVVYSCPSCSQQIAMLTNPHETQVVQSLGVKIGPAEKDDQEPSDGSKCPFSEMVQEMTSDDAFSREGVSWTPQARARLENIPEFVRSMARAGIEKFAADHGHEHVDEEVLDRAKDFFGM